MHKTYMYCLLKNYKANTHVTATTQVTGDALPAYQKSFLFTPSPLTHNVNHNPDLA